MGKNADTNLHLPDMPELGDALYRGLLETANDAVFVADTETGTILLANARAAELIGRPLDKVIGMHQTELHPQAEAQKYREIFREHIEAGARIQADLIVQHADGEKIPVEISASILRAGERSFLQGIFHDLRPRRAQQAALRRSERQRRAVESRYRDLFNNLPVCVYRSTEEGQWLEINDAGLRLLGAADFDDLARRPVSGYYRDPADRERLLAALRADGEVAGWRSRMKAVDGREVPVEIHARLARSRQDHPSYIDGILQDISPLIEGEERMRHLVATFETTLEHMPTGVFLRDEDDRLTFMNPTAETLIANLQPVRRGEPFLELAGRLLSDCLVTTDTAARHELRIPGPPERTFEIAGRAVRPEGSGGTVFAIQDVTEERAREDRLQAQERLAAVGQLAAGIAHDFNNVLMAVNGYTEYVLMRPDLDPIIREKLELVFESGSKAAHLIRQILDFTRTSASEPVVLEINALVDENITFIRRLVPENIRIVFESDAGTIYARIDRVKFQQVLANLAVNARDAMTGGGTFSVRIGRYDAASGRESPIPSLTEGSWVFLRVEDTGDGIPPDRLGRIFEPFFTTKETGRGTGLGLAQVYGIITQHAGQIHVTSQPGRGTVFNIALPEVSPVETALETDEEGPSVPRGRGERILVVEDDPMVRLLLEEMIRALGYRPIMAENGAAALEVLKTTAGFPDLVLTDLVMPTMGGLELAARLREIDPDVSILLLSGYPTGEIGETLKKLRLQGCVAKPVSLHPLASALRDALLRGRHGA